MGEHYGYIAAKQYLVPGDPDGAACKLVCDNQGVVNCAHEGLRANALKPTKYAGLWRSTLNESAAKSLPVFEVHKVKSHQK